jgi:hypothetical protein
MQMIDAIDMADRGTKGDLYEYAEQDRHGRARRTVPYAARHP